MTLGTRMPNPGKREPKVSRASFWLPWSMCVVSVVMTALGFLLMFLTLSHSTVPIYRFWAENTLLTLGSSMVGAVVTSRRPRHPIGWLMCAAGLLWGMVHFCGEYATYALLAAPESLLAGEAMAWLYSWLWIPSLGLVVFLGLLFPTGRLLSRRWRPFAWLSALFVAVGTVTAAFSPGPILGLVSIYNPLGIEGLPNVYEQLQALMFTLIFVASASLLVRLHHARGVERQQIKWFAYAAVVAASASIPTYTIFEAMDIRWLELAGYVLVLIGLLGIPTAVGIAILRYRLYEIDLIINRTLVYGPLTAALIALYLGAVVLLQRLFVVLTGERSTLAVVASTLLIAALFNPLRRRIQGFIDRRFYRRKYDAAKTLEDFSAKLRDETDLDALSNDLIDAVRETMEPAHVSLWLRYDSSPQQRREEQP